MTDRSPINTGRIDWAGENHCLYLEAGPEGPWTAAFSVFRIKWSPFGPGTGVMALCRPGAEAADSENFCLSDNGRLFRWLAEEFALHYGAFKDRPAFETMAFDALQSQEGGHAPDGSYRERFTGAGRDLTLEWRELRPPVPLQLTPETTSTGRHEVFGSYVTAGNAGARLNGRPLDGAVHAKPFLVGETTSAYLIFSESWIVPEGAAAGERIA